MLECIFPTKKKDRCVPLPCVVWCCPRPHRRPGKWHPIQPSGSLRLPPLTTAVATAPPPPVGGRWMGFRSASVWIFSFDIPPITPNSAEVILTLKRQRGKMSDRCMMLVLLFFGAENGVRVKNLREMHDHTVPASFCRRILASTCDRPARDQPPAAASDEPPSPEAPLPIGPSRGASSLHCQWQLCYTITFADLFHSSLSGRGRGFGPAAWTHAHT